MCSSFRARSQDSEELTPVLWTEFKTICNWLICRSYIGGNGKRTFLKYNWKIDVVCRKAELTGLGNRRSESQILTIREDVERLETVFFTLKKMQTNGLVILVNIGVKFEAVNMKFKDKKKRVSSCEFFITANMVKGQRMSSYRKSQSFFNSEWARRRIPCKVLLYWLWFVSYK
jgi:hypothetical protein